MLPPSAPTPAPMETPKPSLPEPYLILQAQLRSASTQYARTQSWCRLPQNQNKKLGAYFKPRINFLVRPPFVMTGLARHLDIGSGEVVFHIHGKFDEVGFIVDNYRTICGKKSPFDLSGMITYKLETHGPQATLDLYRKNYDLVVKGLYTAVFESIVCCKQREQIN